jgi:hypothetical protein
MRAAPRHIHLRPDRLAGRRLPVQHLPAVGESLDEEETAAAFIQGT